MTKRVVRNVRRAPAGPSADMSLAAWCEFTAAQRNLKPLHRRNLRYAVRTLETWAGRPVPLRMLTPELFNRWLAAMSEKLASGTICTRRGDVLSLWNAAADAGLIPYPVVRRLNKLKHRPQAPRAWTRDDLRKVLEACDKLTGCFQNYAIPRAALMRAFVLALWDTALRPWCDLSRLERDWIDEQNAIALQQSKTGQLVVCRLRPETVAAIDATFPPERRLVFGVSYRAMRYNWCLIRKWAGVKGGPKVIRASRATDAERQQPGIAPRILGHVPGSQVAYAHYVDGRALAGDVPEPPAIDGNSAKPMRRNVRRSGRHDVSAHD